MPNNTSIQPIAIIGMACRFPDADGPEQFWTNLAAGRESIHSWPDEDLIAIGIDRTTLAQPEYVKASAILDGIDQFDADFFRLNAREAEITDPQHRLFLECAWQAMEQGGYPPGTQPWDVGVFVAASRGTYEEVLRANPETAARLGLYRLALANESEFIPGWVSYKLGLKGPSLAVQSACSSGLLVVHMACQSLLHGECEMALAGAVSIHVKQKEGYVFQPGGVNSPDGHCRAFDAFAAGTVRGNGLGAILLKPLTAAVRDGDHVRAVIRGSAINNDGAQRVAFTAPSPDGQTSVIQLALTNAGISADSISYVETHGAATEIGDPTEIYALNLAFRRDSQRTGYCAIGSVKTNIGHLNAAAGIAGLIKTVLALEHAKIPPSLHFQIPNPQIKFEDTPFYVNATLRDWVTGDVPRRAGVSSFGLGGTNVHVVLEEAPGRRKSLGARTFQCLSISAPSEAALRASVAALAADLRKRPNVNLADVAFTLHVGRKHWSYRRMLVCRTVAEAVEELEPGNALTGSAMTPNQSASVVMLFPGQGCQYVGMGQEIYQSEPIFRDVLDECAHLLQRHLQLDVREVLHPACGRRDEAESQLNTASIGHPALFAMQYALARTFLELGVRPNCMLGHSLGEYVAACLAGVFSLEDALALVALRARLLQETEPGAMLMVMMNEQDLLKRLGPETCLASVNGPEQSVVSGTIEGVSALRKSLDAEDILSFPLPFNRGFHSVLVDPILERLGEAVETMPKHEPTIPFVSNVTGQSITGEQARSVQYWVSHARKTVRFADGVRTILQKPNVVCLDVGPKPALANVLQCSYALDLSRIVAAISNPSEPATHVQSILNAVGRLWVAGAEIDWSEHYKGQQRFRIPLPSYPFQRRRYWVQQSSELPGNARPILRQAPSSSQATLA